MAAEPSGRVRACFELKRTTFPLFSLLLRTIDLADLREDIAGVLDDHNPNPTAAWWARTAQELLDQLDQAGRAARLALARAHNADLAWEDEKRRADQAEARMQAVRDVLDKADADKAASGWKGSSVVRTAVVRAALDD